MRTSVHIALAYFLAILALTSQAASASGLETSGIGARGRSMGYALAGVADDWSAMYYNPAGLARLRREERACVYEFFSGETRSSLSLRNLPPTAAPDPQRGDFVDFIGDEPAQFENNKVGATVHAGEFGWTGRWKEVGYGFGIFGSGAGSSWKDTIEPPGGGSLEGKIAFSNISVNVPFALAWAPGDDLALGAAINLRLGKLDADFSKVRSGGLSYRLTSEQRTTGAGVGLDLGLLFDISSRWSFGAVWRLPSLTVREGSTKVENTLADFDVDSDTRIEEWIPSRATIGTAFRPTKGSVLALSLTWLDWSAYTRATTYDDEFPGVLEASSGNTFDWQDAFIVSLGAEVPIGGPWNLRGGLVRDEAPEKEEYRTLVGGQTLDVWKAAIGLGRVTERFSLSLGYTHTWSAPEHGYIDGSVFEVSLHEFYMGTTWFY